jgi:two-component system, sensor histidine kinase and response regulator
MNNYSILVIDDEPNNFEVIETLLNAENYDIYYASNGAEALASLDTFNPDVILLDLMMPHMDGLEVCQRLKLMRKWKSIPIVMVTASSGKTVLAECLAAGADDFINKPVDATELRARVSSMLRIKKQFDRIESLTKLQQKNITGLENDLGELGCDLAVSFANELNIPLNSILERLGDLNQNLDRFSQSEILNLVNSANRSAVELQQLTHKFWIYLELALEKKQFENDETCQISQIIEQVAIFQSRSLHREEDTLLELENAKVAVSEQHCEWIVKELLDNGFKLSESGSSINIRSQTIDRQFHLWVTASRLHQNIDLSLEDRELGLSLKIVKKIVDIYDGLFEIASVVGNRDYMAVHITLPLG